MTIEELVNRLDDAVGALERIADVLEELLRYLRATRG